MMKRIMSKEEQLRLAWIIEAERHQKLHELGAMIRGTKPPQPPQPSRPAATKGASSSYSDSYSHSKPKYPRHYRVLSDQQRKLKELGKMVRGY